VLKSVSHNRGSHTIASLVLRKNEQRRIRAGHLWVFSNEIDTNKTPLKAFSPGDTVILESSTGNYLGMAYVNPNSLISARVISFSRPKPVKDLVHQALLRACELRESLYSIPFYRLVHAEADQLPGLIVDRYNDVFVMQLNTAGSERWLNLVVEFLQSRYEVKSIVLRNDTSSRELEGLKKSVEVAYGETVDAIEIEENKTKFLVDTEHGQKTGWFYDQRNNRALLQQLAKKKTVLDLFSYTGGWGIEAARAGAKNVHCVDQSKRALEAVETNAVLNKLENIVSCECADVFDYLKGPVKPEERYDIVVVDPPALIKRRKDVKAGVNAYQQLNQHALDRVKPGGLLVSASCSYHLDRESFRQLLSRAGHKAACDLKLIAQGHQAMDHPVYLPMPETEYLKAFFLRVEKNQ
jgi:23S rRNA (cytosine1962-C5)-methyltransferase